MKSLQSKIAATYVFGFLGACAHNGYFRGPASIEPPIYVPVSEKALDVTLQMHGVPEDLRKFIEGKTDFNSVETVRDFSSSKSRETPKETLKFSWTDKSSNEYYSLKLTFDPAASGKGAQFSVVSERLQGISQIHGKESLYSSEVQKTFFDASEDGKFIPSLSRGWSAAFRENVEMEGGVVNLSNCADLKFFLPKSFKAESLMKDQGEHEEFKKLICKKPPVLSNLMSSGIETFPLTDSSADQNPFSIGRSATSPMIYSNPQLKGASARNELKGRLQQKFDSLDCAVDAVSDRELSILDAAKIVMGPSVDMCFKMQEMGFLESAHQTKTIVEKPKSRSKPKKH